MSFISPGVLPLVPGYASFISGVVLRGAIERQVILTALLFILGFSLVFVALGASATTPGQLLMERLPILGKVAGVLLIIVGLRTIGVFKIPFNLPGAIVVGGSFAFGWTPFISPTLAAILAVASQQDSAGRGIVLLSVYSLGLAVPFLLTALAIDRFFIAFKAIRRHHHAIEIVSGIMMIVTGVLIFTNRFTIVAQWLTPFELRL